MCSFVVPSQMRVSLWTLIASVTDGLPAQGVVSHACENGLPITSAAIGSS